MRRSTVTIAAHLTCRHDDERRAGICRVQPATQQLVVADYDGGTISVIDVSLDEYGNDSSTFGTTYTIPVGNTTTPNPASVTVLHDGSKAYTANQNDDSGTANGTVTVVNLSTHTVEKTITVVGHPRTVVNTQNSEYAKIYVASPDSPYITIIESSPTVTDVIDTTVLVEGTVVDVRTTTQNGIQRQQQLQQPRSRLRAAMQPVGQCVASFARSLPGHSVVLLGSSRVNRPSQRTDRE